MWGQCHFFRDENDIYIFGFIDQWCQHLMPVFKNAPHIFLLSSNHAPSLRDQHISEIRDKGRMAWQVSSGYNQRSRGETQMGRWKTLIGPKLKALNFQNQKTEVRIGVHILNKMTELGRPEFEAVA